MHSPPNNYFGSLANSKTVNQKVNQNSIPCHTTVSVLNINLIHDYCIRHFPKINDYISRHLRYIPIVTFTRITFTNFLKQLKNVILTTSYHCF